MLPQLGEPSVFDTGFPEDWVSSEASITYRSHLWKEQKTVSFNLVDTTVTDILLLGRICGDWS